MTESFREFPKIARLYKGNIVVTEKIDGTNGQIYIVNGECPDALATIEVDADSTTGTESLLYSIFAGSRSRWLSRGKGDNFAFAHWVAENAYALATGLGEGRHFGEWWGRGIQRGYNQADRNFSLFNVGRWFTPGGVGQMPDLDTEDLPNPVPAVPGLSTVPIVYYGPWFGRAADPVSEALRRLQYSGSTLDSRTPAEGVMVFHEASGLYLKAPVDENHKGTG
jgi:hypothetical protein